MSNPVVVSLHQQLKTCFEVLKVNKNVWESVLAECIPLISSLGNLAVQLKALKNVQLANTPLAKFPSLQERLHYKLSLAVDSVLGKLAEKTDALQTVRDAIDQQVSAVFQFYEKNTDTLDIACCISRSATCPSIADMLQWLQDADCYYSLQYPKILMATVAKVFSSPVEYLGNHCVHLRDSLSFSYAWITAEKEPAADVEAH
ncbi:ribosome biogenesis protein C1orf109 homolog isoform X2 [Xyrauchen texanus]|uniref:ribosome biogenesis protein C1orf109 homolog isoform X2 n=1 Tax=Xyrauchen texanus TaxID=154827 RepID=UPI002241D6B2|nr:ribosome biogenesis protein C1orf109 homolog isoform X2 [Xyrauchen texanus]